jgi:hypothetical protein
MKPASLGAAATLLACCFLLTNSATATNKVDFGRVGTLSETTSGLSLPGSKLGSGLIILNGVLFSGTFSGPVSCTLTTLAAGTHTYPVTGVVVGTALGRLVNVVTVPTIDTGMGSFKNSTLSAGGENRTVSSIPEPSTLALLFTGSIATLGMMWRKLLAR